jgi:vitamin B12 transporter
MRGIFIVVLFLSFASQLCYSQYKLNEIIVQENRMSDKSLSDLNVNTQIITKEDIQKHSIRNISEILQYVLGIQATRRGNNNAQTDIKINGGTFEQTLVLINGHPIIDPQTGHHLMNLPLSVYDIEQIEILTGPQAHAYGINGISGAINIVTKRVKENQIFTNINVGSNFQMDTSINKTYNTTSIQLGVSNATKIAKQYLSFSSDIGNGFMYNTQTKNFKGIYTNDITLLKKHKLSILVSYIHNNFGANGFYAAPYDVNSIEKVNTFFTALRHEKKLSKSWTIKSNISARLNKDVYTFIKQNPKYYENTHKTTSCFANTNLNYRYKKGELGIGLSYSLQTINSSNLGTFERTNIGLYAENRYTINSKLTANFGMFTNFNKKWGISILPGINIGYQASSSLKFYATIGSANRMPTYTDLYYKGPSNIGNDQLIQEKSIGYDLGIKYGNQRTQFSINTFHRYVNELIDWTKPVNSTFWQPSNFGNQNVYGLQCYSNFNISNSKKYAFRNITFNYQFNSIHFKNNTKDIVSRYALDFFKHQIITNSTFDFTRSIFTTASIRYQNRFNYTDYTLFDLRIGYNAKKVLFYIDVNNILNTQYLESNVMPMPTRWCTIGGNIQFKY